MSGTITRKDIIEDEALKWGEEYSKIMKKAIEINKEFVDSIVILNAENVKLKRAENQTDFLKQKNESRLATEKVILTLKEQQAEEIKLDKIKQEALKTEKLELDVANKKAAAQKRSTQLTIEERVQNEVNNKALKQSAREKLGLVGAYEKLNTARTNSQKKLADLLAAEVKNKAEIKAAQKEYDILNTKIQKVDKATNIYTKNIGNYKSAVNGLGGMLTNLLGAFGIVGGITLFVGAAKNIFDVTKELQSLDMALKQVTGTQENFATQQSFLKRISEQYGVELKSLTKTYTQFYVAAKDKLSGSEIQKIFESVTKAGATMGLSVESQERAFLALNQMMSKGTIQAEELRGQLGEALPGAFGIMAKALGVNEQQLGKMMKDGKLLAQDVLPKFAAQLEKTYGIENITNVDNLTASQNRLSNAWTSFVRSLDEDGNKMTKFLKGMYDIMTDTVDGWRRVFTSSATERKNYLQSIRDDEKKMTIKYYSDEKKFSDEDLKNKKSNLESEAAAIKKNIENMINVNKTIKLPGFDNGVYSKDQEKSYKLWIKNNEAINKNNETLSQYYGAIEGVNDLLFKNTNKPVIAETDAERNKRLSKMQKEADDYLKIVQKRNNDENELNKFRLEREIYYNQLVVDDETKSIGERTQSFLEIEQIQKSLSDNNLIYQIKNSALSDSNFKKMTESQLKNYKLVIDNSEKASEVEAQNLINNGKLKANATQEEILAYEKYQLEIKKLDDKSVENKQKLIDSQVAIFQEKIDQDLKLQETELNQKLEKENNVYAAELELAGISHKDIETAEEQHQARLFEIKKEYSKKALDLQIKDLENLLAVNDSKDKSEQVSTKERNNLVFKLSKYREERNRLDNENYKKTKENDVKEEEWFNSKALELSLSLKDELLNFANAIFQTKISNINDEIQANNDYYSQQIALAGNNAAQKELLQKEQARKDAELQKKKRKAEYDQAVFEKAQAIASITINTAIAVSKVAGQTGVLAPLLVPLTIALGLAQLATVLATPLPKYKDGRKGGRAEMAVVGDGGRSEVVTDSSGKNAYVTPSTPTLTYLNEGDVVHKSVGDYQEHVRASLINDFDKNANEVKQYQIAINQHNSNIDKLIENGIKQGFKNVKNNVNIQNKIDFGYELWKISNVKWNR